MTYYNVSYVYGKSFGRLVPIGEMGEIKSLATSAKISRFTVVSHDHQCRRLA